MTSPPSCSSSVGLHEQIQGFNFSSLSHVEPVVKHAPIDVDRLRGINPALADFYMEHLAPEASPTQVGLRVWNTFEALSGTMHNNYKWVLHVELINNVHANLIKSVVVDLHPTFSPASLQLTTFPIEIPRTGWGTFRINITVVDHRDCTHVFSHKLTFTNPDNIHEETVSIAPRMYSASSLLRLASPPKEVPTMKTMGISELEMHGRLGMDKGWDAPRLVTFCDDEARPGYASIKAHEFNETPATLRLKVKVLANLITSSKHLMAYTGAGISTAAGVADYASRAKDSVATGTRAATQPIRKRGLEAEPTFAHHVLAAIYRAGYLKSWVQQNHDGLPQKAGVPQEVINEIHGAWFDGGSNPVVPMEGSLRSDLCEWMERQIQATDVAIAIGTSLCGMNADRCISTKGRESVIIGYQQTRLDRKAALRIYAKIDEVMLLLAWELGLDVKTEMYAPSYPPEAITSKPHVFSVPYDARGRQSLKRTRLDLSVGAKIVLLAGPGKGFEGTVVRVPKTPYEHYSLRLPNTREGKELGKYEQTYALGTWMVEAFARGTLPFMTIANVKNKH